MTLQEKFNQRTKKLRHKKGLRITLNNQRPAEEKVLDGYLSEKMIDIQIKKMKKGDRNGKLRECY